MSSQPITSSRLKIEKNAAANTFPSFAEHVAEGLSSHPKRLSPMYIYDEAGSLLFEKICALPEYYLTRTEHSILHARAKEIAAISSGNLRLIELGSGSSSKTRLLIEALISYQQDLHYIPVDISESILVGSAKALLEEYPNLTITAHVAEYNDAIQRISTQEISQKLILFLGSNIGNFEPAEAKIFLRRIRSWLEKGDYLLLSTDMQKDPAVLEAAYDDAQRITEQFNFNILQRINQELDGKFKLDRFSHVARFNREENRVEMHLRSNFAQKVYIGDLNEYFEFARGETIHTENSYKFTRALIAGLLQGTGFDWAQQWTDEKGWFSVNLLAAA